MDRHTNLPRARRGLLALAVAALVAAASAQARPRVWWTAELGAEATDNVQRREDGGDSALILVPRTTARLRHEGARVKAEVDGELENRHYIGGEYGSEFRGGLDAVVDWALLPERLHWWFEDRLSLEPVDLFGRDDPDNLDHLNVFRTGPTFTIRPAANWRGIGELRYANSRAQRNEAFDSDRIEAALRAEWRSAPTAEWSANVEAYDVRRNDEFDFGDYRRHDLFAAHVRRLARFDLELKAGRTEVEFDDGLRDEQSLLRAAVSWKIDPRSTLRAAVRRGYGDATDALIGDPLFEGLPAEQVAGLITVVPDVYRERYAELRYERATDFGVFRVQPYARERVYLRTPTVDQEGGGALLDWRWAVGERWIFAAAAAYDTRDYVNLDRRDRDLGASVSVERRLNSRWSARAALARRSRDSDAAGQSYDENVLLLAAVYRGRGR